VLQNAAGRQIIPLHHAAGSQILPPQNALGSEILPLHDAAGSQFSSGESSLKTLEDSSRSLNEQLCKKSYIYGELRYPIPMRNMF
jgi:hypothetical protein